LNLLFQIIIYFNDKLATALYPKTIAKVWITAVQCPKTIAKVWITAVQCPKTIVKV
jgi:hypothetical protein